MLDLFPEIAAKSRERAAWLSGGQEQILAVAQGLMWRPRLLMLDEPSAGLFPVLVDRMLVAVQRLREAGTAVLLVEQLIEKALWRLPIASTRSRAARSCWKRKPARPICRFGWSRLIWRRPAVMTGTA